MVYAHLIIQKYLELGKTVFNISFNKSNNLNNNKIMTTIENLKQLESQLTSLTKVYSGTLAAISLNEECRNITKVLKFLEEKEEWYKCLYYKHLLKDNINLLSDKEIKELNNNWLTSNDMMKLCDKYNIEYQTINFRQ